MRARGAAGNGSAGDFVTCYGGFIKLRGGFVSGAGIYFRGTAKVRPCLDGQAVGRGRSSNQNQESKTIMKLLTTTATTVAFAVLAGASFAADTTSTRPERPAGGKGKGQKPDSAQVVAHLTAEYSKVSSFDLNQDGNLDATEQGKLAAAITAGTVSFAPPAGGRGPRGNAPEGAPKGGGTPPAERIAERAAGLYAAVAPYDANADGSLGAEEQAALKTAVESGKLPMPERGGPGRGRGHGGPGAQADDET